MKRAQQIVPSVGAAAIGIWIAYISFTQEPAEAFLFPRLIAAAFVALALWDLARNAMGNSQTIDGLTAQAASNLAPGLLVVLMYVFWAATALGFYTATALTFMTLLTLYDPAPRHALRAWIRRLLLTAAFIAVMYSLFALLLRVYTPREVVF